MDEPKPEPKPVYCACGHFIGCESERDGKPVVLIGNLILYAAHGWCGCGAEFHHSRGDRAYRDMMARHRAEIAA